MLYGVPSSFSPIFTNGNNFPNFLFAFLEEEAYALDYKTFFMLNSIEHEVFPCS